MGVHCNQRWPLRLGASTIPTEQIRDPGPPSVDARGRSVHRYPRDPCDSACRRPGGVSRLPCASPVLGIYSMCYLVARRGVGEMWWDLATLSMLVSGLVLVWVSLRLGRDGDGSGPLERRQGDLIGGRGFYATVGVLLAGYGLFVALQTSGTWDVPVLLIAVPWLLTGFTYKKLQSAPQRSRDIVTTIDEIERLRTLLHAVLPADPDAKVLGGGSRVAVTNRLDSEADLSTT